MKHRNRGDGKRGTSVDARASVGIKPNPASVWVVFEYRLVGELEQAYIRVASIDGREVARIQVAESESFNFADGYDGNLAMDSLDRLYITAGRAGTVIRVNREGRAETFLTGLVNPTGVAFGHDGALFVLEAGRSRVLKVAALDKTERSESAKALS